MGKKNTCISLKDKINIIRYFKNKTKSKTDLAKEYSCNISTINRIIRNESKIIELSSRTKNFQRKRNRGGAHKNVENALSKWFDQVRLENAVVTTSMLLTKVKEFAVKFESDFEPNSGWLWRWQKRENIRLKVIQGESAAANVNDANNFIQYVLPSILKDYSPNNIFNADESGLFFKALPKITLSRMGSTVQGGKSQKDRLTLLFICNTTGEYKDCIVVGKRENPRCFKNKTVPLTYFSNRNAWMTSELWNSILINLDSKMIKEKRKIILFADNAACHKVTATLENVKVQFLPANTTSLIQPLDQGIIHAFKSYYRQIIVRKQILAIEKGQDLKTFLKEISILNVMYYIKRAWWMVEEKTIYNSFRKAKLISTDLCEEEENGVEMLLQDQDFLIEPEQFLDYVQCDAEAPCYNLLTEDEIIKEICEENNVKDAEKNEEVSKCDEEPKVPTLKDVISAIDILRTFCSKTGSGFEEVEMLEEKIFKEEIVRKMHQSKITNYFSHLETDSNENVE